MTKTIVMIHGRANKPAHDVLMSDWRKSMDEGLRTNCGESLYNTPADMCYYADLHYEEPLTAATNPDPYIPASPGTLKKYRTGRLGHIRRHVGEHINTPMGEIESKTGLFSKASKGLLRVVMEDLGEYYNNTNNRTTLQRRLTNMLEKYADDEIILVSHSMGTIVAYNVLRELGRSRLHRHITVEHFITLGSPLGLTTVQGHILDEHQRLRTPSCVTQSWANFSDRRDPVCADGRLYDDYEANSRNYVRVRDYAVCNDYDDNPHKSYGYLRTPEFSEHLLSLL